jgi:oxygen-independent coproporphyrinogen-3 oxidase
MGERELSQGAAAAYERKDHTGALSLYIHFPFCVRKCAYCDFLSAPADEETREAYVDALAREIKTAGERIAAQQPGHVQYVDTIYFGGGTPSLMTSAQTDHLLTAVAMSFLVADDAEISAECNPGTADQEKLAAWRSMGINRLSIGAQSFHDDDLKRLGRIHTAAQIGQTFRAARQAGFTNISMDLISSLPGQTTGRAKEDLCSAMALMPEHLSVYSLIIEEDTPFRDMYGSRETAPDPAYLPLPDEDTEREIYHRTWQLLEEGGYRQYEISSAARPGYECFHNIGYWKGHEYLGFGLGAASLYGGARWSNTPDLQEYTEAMSAVPQRGHTP